MKTFGQRAQEYKQQIYNNTINENEDSSSSSSSDEESRKFTKAKRENKNRPMEISSKKPVSRKRQVVDVQAKKIRDPRFDPLCGNLNQDLFKKSYTFLNEYKQSEMDMLKSELKKEKNGDRKRELHLVLAKMKSRMAQEKQNEQRQQLKKEWKKRETELVKQGKKPFFLKASQLKQMELVEKYKQLKESGNPKQLDKVLEKHRKKNASKDVRKMPQQRRRPLTN